MATFNTSQGKMSKRDPNCYLILLPLFRCEARIPRTAVFQEQHICKNRIGHDRIILLFVCLAFSRYVIWIKVTLTALNCEIVISHPMEGYQNLRELGYFLTSSGIIRKVELGSFKVHLHYQLRDRQ